MADLQEKPAGRPRDETLFIVHVVIWAVLVVAAYFTAGPGRLASCWYVVLIYIPPVAILLLAIVAFSAITLLLSVFLRSVSRTWYFGAAAHGTVLVAGLFFCTLASHLSVGRVSCL